MAPLQIHSADNPKFHYLKKLISNAGFRASEPLFVLDHPRSILELIQKQPSSIHALLFNDVFSPIPNFPGDQWQFSSRLWEKLSSTPSPQPLMALLKKPLLDEQLSLFTTAKLLVGLDRIQDPGNAGAIVRSAIAFGADGVLFFEGSASPYHPQTLRGMAGNCFDIPLVSCSKSAILPYLEGWHIAGLDPVATTSIDAAFSHSKTLLVLGSEGQGLSGGFDQLSTYVIPMKKQIESLNVAVAAGIALFISQNNQV